MAFWTEQEDAVLTRLYASHGAAGLANHIPGRSRNSIHHRALALGLQARVLKRWGDAEKAVIRRVYPKFGAVAVQTELKAQGLPPRSTHAIMVQAHKMGVACEIRAQAPKLQMSAADIAQAMRMHDGGKGKSYSEIGRALNYAPTTVSNAILIEEGKRRGFTPAERDANGCLTEAGVKRIREMIRAGVKGVDIQMRCGVSAGCVAEQRRKYTAWCKANREALPPAPGNGEAYCGVKVPREKIREVEALYLEGLGRQKIHERTGVSLTSVNRIRSKLIRRLKRKGECLPGCDIDGNRHRQLQSIRFVPEGVRVEFRTLIMDRVPVKRAAAMVGLGTCSAYRERDALREELAARGEELPKPKLPGRVRGKLPELRALDKWKPEGPDGMYRYRALVHQHGTEEARRILTQEKADALAAQKAAKLIEQQKRAAAREAARAERLIIEQEQAAKRAVEKAARDAARAAREAEDRRQQLIMEQELLLAQEARRQALKARRPMTFEEQLARVAGGTGLVANFKPKRAAPDFTLGGVSSGAL